MQEMFSDGHKDPSLWKGKAKLQSLFPPPPPTEVVFVANIKLTRCWRIFFKGSQGFVREVGEGEEKRPSSLLLFLPWLQFGGWELWKSNDTRRKRPV
jgi:hypothetical protein